MNSTSIPPPVPPPSAPVQAHIAENLFKQECVKEGIVCPMCDMDITAWDINQRNTHAATCEGPTNEERAKHNAFYRQQEEYNRSQSVPQQSVPYSHLLAASTAVHAAQIWKSKAPGSAASPSAYSSALPPAAQHALNNQNAYQGPAKTAPLPVNHVYNPADRFNAPANMPVHGFGGVVPAQHGGTLPVVRENTNQLPPHWEERFANGQAYYVNHQTKSTQWERPTF